ncbi:MULTISPECIES: hypothetical protein [Ochrobactrum]|uniref:Uncharacterized protein n=1 Tax=Ochrobactrum quorumnocens TaxID=271865 RepID=A0A5N1JT36_9HYPH|nr:MULTISPECIES: hypothetical protein [Brucella/Ochrobactrum group]KAA9367066.1 hypothetical protein F3W84_14735 [[Ochrobactrum] quorumnocens]MDH7793096.1 hypothetical protein [Ochrobactrum sp. AN78]
MALLLSHGVEATGTTCISSFRLHGATAIAFANVVDLFQRDARQARCLEIARGYTREVIETFPKVLSQLTMTMQAAPCSEQCSADEATQSKLLAGYSVRKPD